MEKEPNKPQLTPKKSKLLKAVFNPIKVKLVKKKSPSPKKRNKTSKNVEEPKKKSSCQNKKKSPLTKKNKVVSNKTSKIKDNNNENDKLDKVSKKRPRQTKKDIEEVKKLKITAQDSSNKKSHVTKKCIQESKGAKKKATASSAAPPGKAKLSVKVIENDAPTSNNNSLPPLVLKPAKLRKLRSSVVVSEPDEIIDDTAKEGNNDMRDVKYNTEMACEDESHTSEVQQQQQEQTQKLTRSKRPLDDKKREHPVVKKAKLEKTETNECTTACLETSPPVQEQSTTGITDFTYKRKKKIATKNTAQLLQIDFEDGETLDFAESDLQGGLSEKHDDGSVHSLTPCILDSNGSQHSLGSQHRIQDLDGEIISRDSNGSHNSLDSQHKIHDLDGETINRDSNGSPISLDSQHKIHDLDGETINEDAADENIDNSEKLNSDDEDELMNEVFGILDLEDEPNSPDINQSNEGVIDAVDLHSSKSSAQVIVSSAKEDTTDIDAEGVIDAVDLHSSKSSAQVIVSSAKEDTTDIDAEGAIDAVDLHSSKSSAQVIVSSAKEDTTDIDAEGAIDAVDLHSSKSSAQVIVSSAKEDTTDIDAEDLDYEPTSPEINQTNEDIDAVDLLSCIEQSFVSSAKQDTSDIDAEGSIADLHNAIELTSSIDRSNVQDTADIYGKGTMAKAVVAEDDDEDDYYTCKGFATTLVMKYSPTNNHKVIINQATSMPQLVEKQDSRMVSPLLDEKLSPAKKVSSSSEYSDSSKEEVSLTKVFRKQTTLQPQTIKKQDSRRGLTYLENKSSPAKKVSSNSVISEDKALLPKVTINQVTSIPNFDKQLSPAKKVSSSSEYSDSSKGEVSLTKGVKKHSVDKQEPRKISPYLHKLSPVKKVLSSSEYSDSSEDEAPIQQELEDFKSELLSVNKNSCRENQNYSLQSERKGTLPEILLSDLAFQCPVEDSKYSLPLKEMLFLNEFVDTQSTSPIPLLDILLTDENFDVFLVAHLLNRTGAITKDCSVTLRRIPEPSSKSGEPQKTKSPIRYVTPETEENNSSLRCTQLLKTSPVKSNDVAVNNNTINNAKTKTHLICNKLKNSDKVQRSPYPNGFNPIRIIENKKQSVESRPKITKQALLRKKRPFTAGKSSMTAISKNTTMGNVFTCHDSNTSDIVNNRCGTKRFGNPIEAKKDVPDHSNSEFVFKNPIAKYEPTAKSSYDDDNQSVISLFIDKNLEQYIDKNLSDGGLVNKKTSIKLPNLCEDYHQDAASSSSSSANIETWLKKSMSPPTMNQQSSQSPTIQAIPWRNCVFKDYCLDFFKSSVSKQSTHPCRLKHEVPAALSNPQEMNIKERKDVLRAIMAILSSGFTNPPLDLLIKITEFTVKENNKLILLNIGKIAKTCSDNVWKTFISTWLNTAFNSNFNIKQPLRSHCEVVRNLLVKILSEEDFISTSNERINLSDKEYGRCLIAMSIAAKLSERNKNIQLLSIFDFLNSKQKFPFPMDFMLATLRQFVTTTSSDDFKMRFGFKIYKTFGFSRESVKDMHRLQPQIVESYVSFMTETHPSIAIFTDISKHIVQLTSNNQCIQNKSFHQSPLRENNNTVRFSPPEIQTNPTQPKEVSRLSQLRATFEYYRKRKGGFNEFLQQVKQDEVKFNEYHNPVTWSFLRVKVQEKDWSSCVSLFNGFVNIDFETIESFVGEDQSTISVLFSMIEGCLRSNYVHDAVVMFLECSFHKLNIEDWIVSVDITEESINQHKRLLLLMDKEIQNLVNNPNSRFNVVESTLKKLFVELNSLGEPFDLIRCVGDLIDRLIVERKVEDAYSLVYSALENKHRYDLLMEGDSFRIIIDKLVQELEGERASTLMIVAAQLMVRYYPVDLKDRDSTELTIASCLTQREMMCIVQTKNSHCNIRNCTKYWFVEYENSDLITQHLGYVPCDIPSAMARFEEILRNCFTSSCIIRGTNCLMIDRVVMSNATPMDCS